VTVDLLRQAWPGVVDAIKAKGRVAAIVVGNASVYSFDENVLTLRFPRQGDVKGFQGSKYEDLLKQAINSMFGVNVVVRSITGAGGDPPSPGRRPGPGPGPAAPPGTNGQQPPSGYGQPPASGPPDGGQSGGTGPGPGQPGAPSSHGPAAPSAISGTQASPGSPASGGPPGGAAANGTGESTPPFGSPVVVGGDLPPLPPPPAADDDDDFDPDGEGMSVVVADELTGMALVKRELGGQVIAEYED
jgi:DNA polymerase-3 subunit gamma/tau